MRNISGFILHLTAFFLIQFERALSVFILLNSH